MPLPWPDLIAQALVWRYDTRPNDMAELLAFIHYTLAWVGTESGEQQ